MDIMKVIGVLEFFSRNTPENFNRHPSHARSLTPENSDVTGAIRKGQRSYVDRTNRLPWVLTLFINELSRIENLEAVTERTHQNCCTMRPFPNLFRVIVSISQSFRRLREVVVTGGGFCLTQAFSTPLTPHGDIYSFVSRINLGFSTLSPPERLSGPLSGLLSS
jgi:hypothetical protein